MFVALVTGSVVATQKAASMTGHKMLVVEPYRLDEKTREQFLAGIPLRRLGQAEDVAAACVFLGSDASTYITAQTLSVCGGLNS